MKNKHLIHATKVLTVSAVLVFIVGVIAQVSWHWQEPVSTYTAYSSGNVNRWEVDVWETPLCVQIVSRLDLRVRPNVKRSVMEELQESLDNHPMPTLIDPGVYPEWSEIRKTDPATYEGSEEVYLDLERPYLERHDTFAGYLEIGSGWPFPSMYSSCHFISETINGQPKSEERALSGIYLGRGNSRHVTMLPLRPLWRGFLLNTVVYFAMIWSMLWLTRTCIHYKRRKRLKRLKLGQCLACGYSKEGLMNDSACPECGTNN